MVTTKSHCPLCPEVILTPCLKGITDYEYAVSGRWNYLRCSSCGLLVLDPQPGLEELKAAYPPDYHGFHTGARGLIGLLYKVLYRLRVRQYSSLLPSGGRCLDVGCADVPYFDLFSKVRPDVSLCGVEFIDDIAQRARNRGYDVRTGILADLEGEKPYDLIIMNNLIEHVTDPAKELNLATQLLKPGGTVLVETPNTRSWDFSLAQRHWGGLHAPRHTYLFSPTSLEALAQQCGLKAAHWIYPLGTDHWALSVQNWLKDIKGDGLKLSRGRAWFFKYLLFAFIPVNIIQKILGRTGSMVCLMRKPD